MANEAKGGGVSDEVPKAELAVPGAKEGELAFGGEDDVHGGWQWYRLVRRWLLGKERKMRQLVRERKVFMVYVSYVSSYMIHHTMAYSIWYVTT